MEIPSKVIDLNGIEEVTLEETYSEQGVVFQRFEHERGPAGMVISDL